MDALIDNNNEANDILEALCDELIYVKAKMIEMEQQHCLNIYYAKFTKLYLTKNIELIDNMSVKNDVNKLVQFIDQNIDKLAGEWENFYKEFQNQMNEMGKVLGSDNNGVDYEQRTKEAKIKFIKNFKDSVKKYQIALEEFRDRNKMLNDQIANDYRQEDIQEIWRKIASM
jgi:hypothetical protein